MKNAMSMQAKEVKQLKIQLAMTTKLFEQSKPTARTFEDGCRSEDFELLHSHSLLPMFSTFSIEK